MLTSPFPTLYNYTYMNILIPVLFLGENQKKKDTLKQMKKKKCVKAFI